MPRLRISQAQINPTVGDIEANLRLIKECLQRSRQVKSSLVTFPELAICGYPPEDLLIKPRFLKDVGLALAEVAKQCQDLVAVVGFAEAKDGAVYNSAAVMAQGRVQAIYRKVELPNYGVFDEKRYFTPGGECLVMDIAGVRFLMSICEDVWIEGNRVEACAQACQAQVTLNISASPFHAGKLALRHGQIMAGFARRTGNLVFHNNLVGGQDELVFDGASLVMAPDGRVLARAKRFEQDLLVYDLDAPPSQAPAPGGGRCHYLALDAPPAPSAPMAPRVEPELDLVAEVYEALTLGTRDYVRKNGFSKVVLGLSGGIDSSLTAAVAVNALGAENVVGVTMPSQYTSNETKSDAHHLAENLGIKIITSPIEKILAAYLDELTEPLGAEPLGVVAENLQARIRGNILMAFSNRYGWLVLTTGNKSETAVGYCTLYGDMAGGFAVIKDVPKTLVYKVSAYVNQKGGREIIPQSVLTRPPSAELRPDQKDEDNLPPYEVLDPILTAYVEQDKVIDEVVEAGFDPQVVREVARMVDLNEYKRRQAPPGVKITPKAFGRDRRLPITNHYRPGLK